MWWHWVFILFIKRLQWVQLERTALACMEHRKQMPFLSAATATDIEQLSPHGVLLIHERCFTFSCNQLFWILHQNSLNRVKKKTFPDLIAHWESFSWRCDKNIWCVVAGFLMYNLEKQKKIRLHAKEWSYGIRVDARHECIIQFDLLFLRIFTKTCSSFPCETLVTPVWLSSISEVTLKNM